MINEKVTIVTGSSSGIGAAVARRLVASGGRVVLNSARSVDAGLALADEFGDAAVYVRADVSEPEESRRLVDQAMHHMGRLDAIVNSAGTTVRVPFDDLDAITDEAWSRILDTNLLAPWHLAKAARSALAAGSGAIVSISSIAGTNPSGSSIPYAVSKAALNHLTRSLAIALAPDIRVNAVAPGFVETPWTATWPGRRDQAIERTPLQRVASPDDVAQVCVMLLEAGHVTGEIVHVDGGQRLVV